MGDVLLILYMIYTKENQKNIYKKIRTRSKRNKKTGCLVWRNFIDKQNQCKMLFSINGNRRTINVSRFIWSYYNKIEKLKMSEICIHTCQNPLCNEIKHLQIISRFAPSTKEEVWERLLKNSTQKENKCIIWNGTKRGDYGSVGVNGKYYPVHRVSLWIHNSAYEKIEDIPQEDDGTKLVVRHKCNDPICFNPDHLLLGTEYENCYDDRILHGTLKRGDDHYNSKITADLAQTIKLSKYDRQDPRYLPCKERAIKFGVSLDNIKAIDSGSSWAHIPDINGQTSTRRLEMVRKHRKTAKDKVWTNEMWSYAKKRLDENSEFEKESNKFVGTPCQIWKKGTSKFGYGKIYIHGLTMSTHVLSCAIKRKKHRENGEVTRHKCANPLCINSDHLEFGSYKDNAIDSIKHGTSQAKLCEEDVNEIRKKYDGKDYDCKYFSEKYNVSQSAIRHVVKRITWKHI